MRNYCTLFDKNYLAKGLAMCRSLLRVAPESRIWVLCMDEETRGLLEKVKEKNMELLSLSHVEDKELLRVKSGRTTAEYCWTLSSSLPLYILEKHPEVEMITYLDSDLYFFSSPQALYQEIGSASVVIVPHRYTPALKHLEAQSGTYNVAWVGFRNNNQGLTALRWWRERVLEWCYARFEDGKFGDQMYLNDWPTRFEGVHAVRHVGANLAPWNASQYTIRSEPEGVVVDNKPLIFYHFQGLRIYPDMTFLASSSEYDLSATLRAAVYEPHYAELRKAYADLRRIEPGFSAGLTQKPPLYLRIKKIIKSFLHL